jgi:hypothetical protein
MPNYIAIQQINPTACGERTTTYYEQVTNSPLSWFSIIEDADSFYTFRVNFPPSDTPLYTPITFWVTSTLTDYPLVSSSTVEVILTFICPVYPNSYVLIGGSPQVGTFAFDTSQGTGVENVFSLEAYEMQPPSCIFSLVDTFNDLTDLSTL